MVYSGRQEVRAVAQKPGHKLELTCHQCSFQWVDFDALKAAPDYVKCPRCDAIMNLRRAREREGRKSDYVS